MELSQDEDNNSLLALAVTSDNTTAFEAAMDCVDHDLTEQEVLIKTEKPQTMTRPQNRKNA